MKKICKKRYIVSHYLSKLGFLPTQDSKTFFFKKNAVKYKKILVDKFFNSYGVSIVDTTTLYLDDYDYFRVKNEYVDCEIGVFRNRE